MPATKQFGKREFTPVVWNSALIKHHKNALNNLPFKAGDSVAATIPKLAMNAMDAPSP